MGYTFGIFTDNEEKFNNLKLNVNKEVNISDYQYGCLTDINKNNERPFRCTNNTVSTDWKYFIPCKVLVIGE